MKKHIREFTAFLLAAVLFFTVSWKLGQLLMPVRTVYGSDWEAFLQEEPNSHDILFFGSSLVYCDVIPAILWEETGLTSYVMAGPEQTIPTSYYYAKECFRTQKPRLVVQEVTGMFYPQYTNYSKANVGYMPFGVSRLEATFAAAESEQRFGLLFPLYNYHYRWQDVSRGDLLHHLKKPRSLTAGYTLLTDVCPPPYVGDQSYTAGSDNYRRNVSYLKKLQTLCSENGAELMLYVAPSGGRIPADAMAVLRQDLAEMGLSLVDFNADWDTMGLHHDTDWYDRLHFNARGAATFTRHLGRRLTELYGLTPRESVSEIWDRRLEHIHTALGSLQAAQSAAS